MMNTDEKKDAAYWGVMMRNLAPFLFEQFNKAAKHFECDFYEVFMRGRFGDGDMMDPKNNFIEMCQRKTGKYISIEIDPTTGTRSEMQLLKSALPACAEEIKKLQHTWCLEKPSDIFIIFYYKKGMTDHTDVDSIGVQFREKTNLYVKEL